MNIKYIFLAILMGTSMLITANQIEYSEVIDDETEIIDDEIEQKNWIEPYVMPCIGGGVVGFISGKISGKICIGSFGLTAVAALSTENKVEQGIIGLAGLSVIIGTLIAENKLRAKCVDWLNQKNKNYGMQLNDLTENSARILSWITFVGIL